jgi:hypothetical protein
LGSNALLAAVRQLKQLTYLCLVRNAGLTEQGLMQLTSLKQLQQLLVDKTEEVTDEVLSRFWSAVQQRQY